MKVYVVIGHEIDFDSGYSMDIFGGFHGVYTSHEAAEKHIATLAAPPNCGDFEIIETELIDEPTPEQ